MCFVAMPVCLTQTAWTTASCTTSGMAPAIKLWSGGWRRFRTKQKASVRFLEVWMERVISMITPCMGLRSFEVITHVLRRWRQAVSSSSRLLTCGCRMLLLWPQPLLLWLADAAQPSVLHWMPRRLIAMAYTKQVPGPAKNGRSSWQPWHKKQDSQMQLRSQHIDKGISDIDPGVNCKGLLVGYGHSLLKTLLTMSHLSEKKFINDKVLRFYRMCQCQMLCVFCFVTKNPGSHLISFWHSLEDQDHIRKITKCKGVKRQWLLFLLRKSRSKNNSYNSSLQESCTKSSQS